ncbi:helicase POLQ-like [Vanessa tameamea]|uniref:Helicase POLQ-like n=1 Tax=Vanessa tameamea TaxID=334116 RepID=A0ABM4ASE2_VANTA
MNFHNEPCDPSTPKRRRLGITKTKPQNVFKAANSSFINTTPIQMRLSSNLANRCDSPPLPCNQIEYLSESTSSSSVTNDIPCSPGVFETCFFKDIANWDSFKVSKNKENILKDYADEFNDEFQTRPEQNITTDCSISTSKCEKLFRDEIEQSFNNLNQSIINININKDKSSLFETNDSFLLDIRESGIITNQENSKNDEINKFTNNQVILNMNQNNFYGLPMIVKGLFKTYRKIEKFYDWQEECLNLDTIKERRNLIYALPTSGGKTLVAEVLMLREILNRKKNALFILPFVAIVQEKIWSLAPFALQLDFLVEEYAGGKGHIPPKKRRKKNSIYIATIEKGLALIRSLIELDRLDELGLIVVDELHLIGEPGRGSTLEMLLTTVIFANKGIQIVGMSATIGNLPDLATFLKADVYEKQFRPVELVEYVKLGNVLHRIVWGPGGMEIVPDRELSFDYSRAGAALDPDALGGLVAETAPRAACLVFCPTKRNCENVAALLCKLRRREMTNHRVEERVALQTALRNEGAGLDLVKFVRFGVAFHHAGLAGEERSLLEHAFRAGVISVLCCTSTLAAGVNLPARRVIIRAPLVGREFITLGAYRQMAGRAGRAGACEAGESVVVCAAASWARLRAVLAGGLGAARSALGAGGAAGALLLSGAALRLAGARRGLRALLRAALLPVAPPEPASRSRRRSCKEKCGPRAAIVPRSISYETLPGSNRVVCRLRSLDVDRVCDDAVRALLESGALEVVGGGGWDSIDDDTELAVSKLGRAAIKGCMELSVAKRLLEDLEIASRSLVLMGSLHLLYLVTPHDSGIKPDYRHYYSLYCELDEEGVQTAKILGITEMNAIRMMTGKPITNVPESVLCRFYIALMLRDLWRQMPFPAVAEKYGVSRGALQAQLAAAAAFAGGATRLCEELPARWGFRALLEPLALRLQHCAAPGLERLLALPAVRKARALQLLRAGYKCVEDVARASAGELTAAIGHLSRTAADHLVSSARMMLIEKVENLRAEAEDVMEGLKI